mgnify:FL=1
MTKEQEVIEKLTNGREEIDLITLIRKFKKEGIENFVVTKKEYIETVLSMLKEKDKQIDLMAEFISKQDVEEEICIKNKTNPDWCNEDYTNCKDCIKQYYERKSKE